MDARRLLLTVLYFLCGSTTGIAQVFVGPRSVVDSANFRVFARTTALANQIAQMAEENRKKLAIHWLGQEIPNWPQRCPLTVNDGPNKPASGETQYTFIGGGVANFKMLVSGTPERIIDSVLPHEITHTIMASHFASLGKPVPRWADEGACTTVEHPSEKNKHDSNLVVFLGEGRGIPFATLFALTDYPPDQMPLYAQGYSLTCFLIAQGGETGSRRFVKFLERGMKSDDWVSAVNEYYDYPKLGKLQTAWNLWVKDGGGPVTAYTANALGVSSTAIAAITQQESTLVSRDPYVRSASVTLPWSGVGRDQPNLAISNSNVGINERSPTLGAINKSMDTSLSSYYVEQLRRNQPNTLLTNLSPADRFEPAKPLVTGAASNQTPYVVSQPGPMQSIGGGEAIRR